MWNPFRRKPKTSLTSILLDLMLATMKVGNEIIEDQAEQIKELRARKDAAYLERNQLVALLATHYRGVRSKTDIEGWDDDWHNVVYMDTPAGQMSWHYHSDHAHLFDHLPFEESVTWDGHSTELKYERVRELIANMA